MRREFNAPPPYKPEKLPLNLDEIFQDVEVNKAAFDAGMALGTYRGFLQNMPDLMLLIAPLASEEAVLSSKLEGTHATMEDYLNYGAGNGTKIELDEMHEISNYQQALHYAQENLALFGETERSERLPLSCRVIKKMHAILLSNVRGQDKNPGQFKRFQNYIGSSKEITFTPVAPNLTDEYMHNFEEYLHYNDKNPLIQAAIMHAQFEMIHPFEDGNGRIGRLLIPLFLYYRELLPYPTFYMSSYFEKDRRLYLQSLAGISAENNWREWILYFLAGLESQASLNTNKAQRLQVLFNDMRDVCLREINSKYTLDVLNYIFSKPVFKKQQLVNALSDGERGASIIYSIVNKIVELGYLTHDDKKRNTTYFCNGIIDVVK